jgi:hypothetical protein
MLAGRLRELLRPHRSVGSIALMLVGDRGPFAPSGYLLVFLVFGVGASAGSVALCAGLVCVKRSSHSGAQHPLFQLNTSEYQRPICYCTAVQPTGISSTSTVTNAVFVEVRKLILLA